MRVGDRYRRRSGTPSVSSSIVRLRLHALYSAAFGLGTTSGPARRDAPVCSLRSVTSAGLRVEKGPFR